MSYYEERLKLHQEHQNRIMSKDPEFYWVQRTECERFTPEEKARGDVLFKEIGIDPDLYLDYARAQVVRARNFYK